MRPIIDLALEGIRFGEPQKHNSVAVFPILGHGRGTYPYKTMAAALAAGELTITEVSESGSVPQLAAVNTGAESVLLIDGEEVAGARQNRILNSSILVEARSKVIIPVSCTEQGRWQYTSPTFSNSGYMAERVVRSRKTASVETSLRHRQEHRSDQGAVWGEVHAFAMDMGVHSGTGAMRDVFESNRSYLSEIDRTFRSVPGQRGLMVTFNGWILGMDVLSRSDAYVQLHSKLLGSYLVRPDRYAPPSSIPTQKPVEFAIAALRHTIASPFPSPGLGTDVRLRGANCFGSALVHENEVIHLSCFFESNGIEDHGGFASFAQRRRFRQ